MSNWKETSCPFCSAGIVFSAGYESVECSDCNGSGKQFIDYNSGVIALYPGGPFVGKLTERELEEIKCKSKVIQ